jgi:hypothetical protein
MIPLLALSALVADCAEKEPAAADDHGHPHEKGKAHDHDHEHDEVPLGTFKAGDIEIVAAQGHGKVEADKEGHLVIKLPYKDEGATIVRAWIGTEDRTLSAVGKGDYTAAHGDYDIHATAPSPLPADAKWWVEIEKPDGTKLVGSIAPKM